MARHRAHAPQRTVSGRRHLTVAVISGSALTIGAATALVLTAGLASSEPASQPMTAVTGTFVPGSGNYLLSEDGTDAGRDTVSGTVEISQSTDGTGPITARVQASGLNPGSVYVAVGYKDAECLPTPGVTAFPSAAFSSDNEGNVNATVKIDPKSTLPTGTYVAGETRSISIRQVVLPSVGILGTVTTPNLPNAATPEACDRTLT